jgi:hypothetical protein
MISVWNTVIMEHDNYQELFPDRYLSQRNIRTMFYDHRGDNSTFRRWFISYRLIIIHVQGDTCGERGESIGTVHFDSSEVSQNELSSSTPPGGEENT